MPIPSEYEEIIDLLIGATENGRVRWVQKSHVMAVQFSDFDFEVWDGYDDQGQTNFAAMALRSHANNKSIENWVAEERSDINAFSRMIRLSELARRSALKIDERLSTMKRALRSGQKVGLDKPPEEDDDIPF